MKKIAFFGTSHTYGSCSDVKNDRIDHAWPEHMAERLGADHLNFGLPGSTNFEMQIIFNETINDGLLDDVDTVIIEPRLSYDHILWNNYDKNHEGTRPLYAMTKAGSNHFGHRHDHYDELGNFHCGNKCDSLHHKYVQEINLNNLDNKIEYERKMKKPIHRLMLDKMRHAVETIYYYNQDDMGMLYQSYQYLRVWGTMCKLLDKKFYWMNWSSIYGENKKDAILDPYFQDILDLCINPQKSVTDFMARKMKDENKNYVCECNHHNVEAQPIIAEFLIENIKKIDSK